MVTLEVRLIDGLGLEEKLLVKLTVGEGVVVKLIEEVGEIVTDGVVDRVTEIVGETDTVDVELSEPVALGVCDLVEVIEMLFVTLEVADGETPKDRLGLVVGLEVEVRLELAVRLGLTVDERDKLEVTDREIELVKEGDVVGLAVTEAVEVRLLVGEALVELETVGLDE
jgi:hypothetical protein